jgi:hypothetical protein
MTILKRFFAFLFLVASASCIDPYIPNLKNYNSLLVVEGLITNENSSYKMKLGRTFNQQNSVPENITDANVLITDGDGIKTELQNCGNGYYKTDSTSFSGVIGQKYTLQILTSDGNEYKSEEYTMSPVVDIDKIYYEKAQEISGNNGELLTGLKILLNSSDSTGLNKYFRWTYEETWKFIVPYPQEYTYQVINDTTFLFLPVPALNRVCWNENKSGDILTNVIHTGENSINSEEIQFIAPLISNRLTLQYSILVKQYSVSEKEYIFWNNVKKVGDSGGDIFASQPYTVTSNIHNVNNTNDRVLGYFGVSSVSQKRIYITNHELESLDLPSYKTDCEQISVNPDDYALMQPPVTWEALYSMFTGSGKNIFVRPEVSQGSITGYTLKKNLSKFVFAPKTCALCELIGFTSKPDFWIDLQ